MKVGIVNFGCPKNLVDVELMTGICIDYGYEITLNPEEADIVIVNTCAFIHDAQKESLSAIFDLISIGKPIIVTGCLSQRYKEELKKEIPEIFGFLGTSEIEKIGDVIKAFENKEIHKMYSVNENPEIFYPEKITRGHITVGSSAYLKIAEGCNYNCAYCIIPKLRGHYHSRSIDNIVKEAKKMADIGISEIILIAQDTSYYGFDKFSKSMLSELLKRLNEIDNINWIRVLYMYPSMIDDELIDTVAECEKVVKYFDIPMQHSHPEILKKMNRPVMDYEKLISKIREKIPHAAIRTSLIVGFPTETDEHFEHLLNFVKNVRFDRLGVFEFSREEGTQAYDMKPQILSKIKKERKKIIMQEQSKISLEINQNFIGQRLPVLIEAIPSSGDIIARSFRDAPEIDGLVYIKNSDRIFNPGDIEEVTIADANEYDLFAE